MDSLVRANRYNRRCMGDDELDELLSKLERRADRLKKPASANVSETEGFGRLPSAVADDVGGRPRPGDSIGESYEVEETIAHTDGATVLKVRHRGVERQFAMKLLPNDLARDDERVERFQDEARAASVIGHENIVFVTDFGRSNRFGYYYVMEYLNGETLDARLLREGAQEMDAALNVALCAGSALAAVHELDIVHRDVRPGNLLSHRSDGEETWKLFDFGASSKVVDAEQALGLYGEPLYVAPEQAAGEQVDARADQFALAAVLIHVLTGSPPWPKRTWTTATPDHWCEPGAFEDERIAGFREQVFARALSVDPDDRYDDIESFIAAFQRTSGRSRRPTIPPIDVQEAARAVSGEYASASVTIGTTFESEVSEVSEVEVDSLPETPSLEVSLNKLADTRTKIEMVFQHADRLRREWRRNLVSGGIFIPTERTIAPGTQVVVAIRFGPTGEEQTFPARVMDSDEDEGAQGVAVEIDADLRDDLHEFLYGLNLGLLEPSAVVRPIMGLRESADLTADEAFLMSRLTEPTKVGRLRTAFASLPIDFEEILEQLLDKEYVEIVGGRRKRSRSDSGAEPAPSKSETSKQRHFVRMTLERADYFRERGNFLAEIEALELAAERVDEPEFHYRAGLSKVQFQNDIAGAVESMRRAVELAPDTPKYSKALSELERLNGG